MTPDELDESPADMSPETMARHEAEFRKRHANSKPMVPEIFSRSAVEGGIRGDIGLGFDDEPDDDAPPR